MTIFCPVCAYHPHALDRWICAPGCHTIWNTFDTHALCPGCSKQWRVTACPACELVSAHIDWYHEEESAEAEQRREREQLAGAGVG
jgi:hypothetical protein